MANVIELIAKLKDEMSAGLGNIEKNFKRLADNIKRGALVIGAAFVGLIGNSIRLASAFEEAESKFNIVFGEAAPRARAELERLAGSLGRSSNKWLGFAATIQDTLVPLGFARDAAADMSVELVALAVDMSSLSNVPMEQVITDLQSALVGNVETLRKYGVALNQETIQTFALANAIWDGTSAITAQEKAAAILGLTVEGTSDAQGNAALTADSFANTMRSAGDQLHDYQVELGQKLLPILAELISEHMPGFIASLEDIVPPMVTFVTNVTTLVGLVANLVTANKQAAESTELFEGTLETLGNTLTGEVADKLMTADQALEEYNDQVMEMARLASTSMDDMIRWYDIHKAGSVNVIEGRVAVQLFRDSIVQLTLVQLANLKALMQSMSVLPGFSQVSQAAFEQLNAEITQQLISAIDMLGSSIGDAKDFMTELWDVDPPTIVPPGLISDDDMETEKERRAELQATLLAEMDAIRSEELGAIERRTESEMAAIAARKRAAIEAREEIRATESEDDAERLAKTYEIANAGVTGAREVGRLMISGVEGWEERALQALALMALKAAAIQIGGPIGGVLAFIGGLFKTGGTVRHAQTGTTVPDAGIFGDRHPYMLERGETVTSREQTIMGNLGGDKKPNINIQVTLQSTLSTASPGDAVRAGKEINRILKAGGY